MLKDFNGFIPTVGSQAAYLSCPIYEVLLHGTRGGGKTIAILMDYAQHCEKGFGAAWKGVIFRCEYKELNDIVTKSKEWFPRIFGNRVKFHESFASYKWVWNSGEELLFRAAKTSQDYDNYHGQEFPYVCFDELTNWKDDSLYLQMMSVNRCSKMGVPIKYRATCNPSGVGHNWVKKRFIDKAPALTPIVDDVSGLMRVHIFSNIQENNHLLSADPTYVNKLAISGTPNQVKAWLSGSWDITAGGALDDLFERDLHVVKPFKIPQSWYIDRTLDHGSSAPSAVLYFAESNGEEFQDGEGNIKCYPKGTLFVINEIYTCEVDKNGEPNANKGTRLTPRELARLIKVTEHEMSYKVNPGPADNAIWANMIGVTVGSEMEAEGVRWLSSEKSSGSRAIGLTLLRQRLKAGLQNPMEEAGIFFFSNCRHTIRTLPVLPIDDNKPDDIDTDAEDHAYDAIRYRLYAKKREITKFRV
jgi:hypothetical protein